MKLIITVVVVAIAALAVMFWPRSKEQEPLDPVYMYYPKANIYYHVSGKTYILKDTQLATWVERKDIAQNSVAEFGKGAMITITDTPIWKNNAKHRLIYGTSLYTSPEEVKRNYRADSIKSIPPPKPVAVDTSTNPQEREAEKRRSGFRRFVDKIFKKKE